MRSFAVVNDRSKALFTTAFALGIVTAPLSMTHVALAQTASGGTTVGVTVCTSNPTITLTKPVSDSVVTSETVPIEGTVSQAAQIEVQLDGAFNTIIPLNIGQSTFSSTVQIEKGTHTITVTAINSCAGDNVSADSVVTYELPPQEASVGSDTPTTVTEAGSQVNGIAQGEAGVSSPNTIEKDSFSDIILAPIERFATWLNIDTNSKANGTIESNTLTLPRASVLTVGVAVTALGFAPAAIHYAASLPVVVNALPAGGSATGRIRIISWALRFAGLGTMFGVFFF